MRRRLSIWIVLSGLSLVLAACGGNQPTATPIQTPVVGLAPTQSSGTLVVTSSIPTLIPLPDLSGQALPVGTLILRQLNKPVAQLPTGQTVTLSDDRFTLRGSPNARYGIHFNKEGDTTKITLIDYTTNPNTTKDVPQGSGLFSPSVTWKDDSSGFAFFDFPPADKASTSRRTIYYYDIVKAQTTPLYDGSSVPNKLPGSLAFSPDSTALIYAINDANSEGIGGPGSQAFLLDISTGKSQLLPSETMGFSRWLRDSTGFLVIRLDTNGISQIFLYNRADLTKPKSLTPDGVQDTLIDTSPDGKKLVVSSAPTSQKAQPSNIYIMDKDGSNRKQLTQFTNKDVDQSITGLVWGNDGIYYSLTAADNTDSTWRMDLDGTNAKKLASGRLSSVVSIR